jgi:hypothetical protein
MILLVGGVIDGSVKMVSLMDLIHANGNKNIINKFLLYRIHLANRF